MPKENRRVKMTKMLLNESFLKFLAEKPLARITIKEICEDADVNRSTYYAHFTDPYDQLKKLESDIMIDMTIYVDNIVTEGLHDDKKQRQIIRGILEYIQSKKYVFQVLLEKGGDFDLQHDILAFFGERIFRKDGTQVLDSGYDNEVWSFGEENFEILKNLIFIREKLRPYIKKQMDTASEKGYPVMRPMFFEYPDDEICYTLDGQYMFGDDIIFAPIVNKGQTVKSVYIPDGEWILTKDKKVYTKGTYEIKAEIDEFVAFVKQGSDVIKCFE